MVKTQICLSTLAAVALCNTTSNSEQLAIIRKNPHFFIGDWTVEKTTAAEKVETNHITSAIPTGNMTFEVNSPYKTYAVSTKWLPEDLYKDWNEVGLGLDMSLPSALSFDDAVAQGKIMDMMGRNFRVSDLNVVESDAKNVKVSFNFAYADSDPSVAGHWNTFALSKLVPIDSIKEEKVTQATGPFDPAHYKESDKFFNGLWNPAGPYTEEDVGKSMCCIPMRYAEIIEDSTNPTHNNITVEGWAGAGCDHLDFGHEGPYWNSVSEFSLPKANFEQLSAKPFQTDFKKLVISAKDFKEIVLTDGSVHQSFELTTNFSAYNSTIKTCSVNMRRPKPLLEEKVPEKIIETSVEAEIKSTELKENPLESHEKPAEAPVKPTEVPEKPVEAPVKPVEREEKPNLRKEEPKTTESKPSGSIWFVVQNYFGFLFYNRE